MTVGFFVVPVAFTRSVFRPSDAARLPIPQLRGYSVLAASPAVLRASRSRSPAVRQFGPGAATRTRAQTRAGTPTEAGLEPDLRCTQPLLLSTTRPPVLPPPPSSATPAHSNHPPARNLQPDYRPESSRLARSHSPDPSRNPDRSRNPEPGPQPNTGLSSFPSFRLPRRLPRLEPGTKKRPHVTVRASVSPKIGRITSRSSRRSP